MLEGVELFLDVLWACRTAPIAQVPSLTLSSYCCAHFSATSGTHGVVWEISQPNPLLSAGSPTLDCPGHPEPCPVDLGCLQGGDSTTSLSRLCQYWISPLWCLAIDLWGFAAGSCCCGVRGAAGTARGCPHPHAVGLLRALAQ